MSKSLARVIAALSDAGVTVDLREMDVETRTAEQAAAAVGCALDQIVKSILFQGEATARLWLFLSAGGNRVDLAQASALAGEALGRADAADVRRATGFAIGGVAPIGHLTPSPVFMDQKLMDYAQVWAAAGTPRHVFGVDPAILAELSAARVTSFCE